MNGTSGMSEERRDELVEEYLRYIRGTGPEPDLSGVSLADAEDLRRSFAIVDALSGALPSAPPIEDDPVAARLGLVHVSKKKGGSRDEG
jgi:hypothetical protein